MKKLFLFLALCTLLCCLFVLTAAAETPELYIEFQVKMAGKSDYTTVYVENPEAGNPRINLTFDFYYDLDFTQVVDKSQITVLDFSGAVHSNPKKDYVDRFTTADPSVFPLCQEVKWFTRKFTSAPSSIFNNWAQLKRFDFGCITSIDYNFLSNTGLEEVILPASVNKLNNSVFAGCTSLKSVTILGGLTSVGSGSFQNCTALETVNLGSTTKTGESMLKGCTALTTVDLSANTLTNIGKFAFSGCTSLKTIISSGVNQEGAAIIPEGVTWIGQEAFYNCDSIKYLSLPSTVTYLGPSVMRDSSGVEFIDFNENQNAINLDNWGHFSGCSGLKAVSLPDGIKIINNRFMTSCTSMQAVYLPANLEQMNTNGNGQGPFCYSAKMYFVQDNFEVRDENGYFLGSSFVMPEKPEVYYMPTNLSKAGGNVNSGTWFRECASLNNTIVMPEAFTESTVVQMFRGIASSSQQKNVVYLGRITNYAWSEMNKYINFVFANPGNTDLDTITFTSFYNRNNENCYFYFCHTGFRYTMAKANADEVAATKVENTYCHIAQKTETQNATCTQPKMTADFCFCGQFIPGTETTEGVALGHALGEGYHIFTSLTVAGKSCKDCTRCDYVEEIAHGSAVYVSLGYSVKTYGTSLGFSNGYRVDVELLAAYESTYGVTVSFGFAFNLAEGFDSENATLDSFKINAPVAGQGGADKYGLYEYVMKYENDEHLATDIVIAAYVVEKGQSGESLTFINKTEGGFEIINYNKALELAE